MSKSNNMETKNMPVNFGKDLGYRCPICKQIIQPTDDVGFILHPYEDYVYNVIPCPHLVWILIDEIDEEQKNGLAFGYVRNDISQKIVKLIREDPATQYRLEKRRIKVSERRISYFLSGKYEYLDKISMLFARLPIVYEQLLSPSTILYQHEYCENNKMQFAIETL
ncbi:MAG: hypothetical protein JXB49_07845 [Bacteroidales bacterium]|nr:hypothetical protein [Bacteroidales bacterium]